MSNEYGIMNLSGEAPAATTHVRDNSKGHLPRLPLRSSRPLERGTTELRSVHVPSTKYQVLLLAFIIHYSLFITPTSAQPVQQSEIPTPLSERTLSTRFENLGVQQGLSQSTVFDILQDRHGFMWFATFHGINRYDGYKVDKYHNVPFDSTSMGPGYAYGIHEDHLGYIWVAQIGGLSVLDPATGTFTRYRYDEADSTGLPHAVANDILEDPTGRIWVGTEGGVAWMDRSTPGRFHTLKNDPNDESSLTNDQVTQLYLDAEGGLWVGTQNGVNLLDLSAIDGGFRRFLTAPPDYERVGHYYVRGFYEREEVPGVIWLATGQGLVRLNKATGESDLFKPPVEGRGGVAALTGDPQSRNVLWVSVGGQGLARFDVRSGQFIMYGSRGRGQGNLSDQDAYKLYKDRSGVIWVGTASSGADRFNPSMVTFSHLRADPEDPLSLPANEVWGVFQERSGVLWVGTASSGTGRDLLSRIDRQNGLVRHFEHDPDDPYSLIGGRSHHGIQDRSGTVWIGARGPYGGLSRYDARTGRFYHIKYDPDRPEGLVHPSVNAFIEDASGALWIGTWGGISQLSPDRTRFKNYKHDSGDPNSLSHNGVWMLMEDQAGFIWAATIDGLNRLVPETGNVTRYFHDESDTTSLSSSFVYSLIERKREPGILWLGTDGGGLNRLDATTGKATHFFEEDGLANNVIYGVLEDEQGRLWMSTNNGLSRFTPETNEFRNYGLEIGLQGLEFNGAQAHHKGPLGEMFFGGPNGLNAFFPNELSENVTAPEVGIVDLRLSNRSSRETRDALGLKTAVVDADEVRLSHDQKDITFDFVAFHYEHPELNEFQYKLEGYSDDWVDAGRERSATYTNLPPGRYVFRVRAANSDGVWNEDGASLRIIVDSPFWATWWFRLLALIGFGGLLYIGYSLRIRQIAERNRALEDEVEKRTAEVRESHARIATTNEQLEQSHTIVEAINQETSFRRLLTKILEEARVIPGVEKATALIRMPDDLFHVRASAGWDVSDMQHIRLTRKDAHQRYVEQAEEVSKNIFVAKDVAERTGTVEMDEFGRVASFLVLRVMVEGDVTAYLVFDNLTNPDAFDHRDVALLERLREHIQSAFIKTRILEDLQSTLDNLRSTQDRLVQSQKMASLGQLTAGIAHEIKNPLNFVNNFSEVTTEIAEDIAEELGKRTDLPADFVAELTGLVENLRANTQKVAQHGKRADAIVQNMLEHSKVGEGERQPTELNDLLDEYVTLARHGLEARSAGFKIDIERHFDEAIGRVDLVPQDMGRVFMNLLSNAFDALKEHGANGSPRVTVTTARVDDAVEIRVADNGPGIPEKVRARIFEPFFTTKPTGSGTGLGLSMSYDIVTKGHGGTLEVISEEGQGATFIVRLPV
ncbi:MAG TPA: two-component regulator propeller domain-containing protein [Rhodothermia bacterium]